MVERKKSRVLLVFAVVAVMLLSIVTASFAIYNNRSNANPVTQSKTIDNNKDDKDVAYRDVELSEDDKEIYNDTSPEQAKDGVEETDDNQEKDIDSSMMINPKEVRYMQSSINNRTGEYTVLGNAEALKNGTLKPTDLALIRLWKDDEGRIWTLDHRRLVAFRLAGIEKVPFKWATKEEVESQMWKMTTTTEGKTIDMRMGNGVVVPVKE